MVNVVTTGLSRETVRALFVAGAVLCVQCIAPHQAAAATWRVPQGADLQEVLSRAEPGDEIVLQSGARFVGAFWLPTKTPGPAITIRSEAPLPERRLTPADASLLPTIASGSPLPALDATGASNWKLDGIRFESTTTGEGEIIVLQDADNITLDRLLIVAGANGQQRAIRGNGRHIVLSRSHIANIWREDSQAFCAWDGAGPYTIIDNYLEAASENVMFGGAASASPDRVPADILVDGNHLTKRLEWRGTDKGVKNLLELRQAKRAVIRNNLMERVWPEAQSGYAILLSVRNDDGNSPWAVVEDVLFEANIVREAYAGVSVLGYDLGSPSGQTTRVTFRDNRFMLSGPFLLIGGEAGVVTLDHNTVRQGGSFAALYTGEVWPSGAARPRAAQVAAESLTITNTIGNHNEYGVHGDGVGSGARALSVFTRSSLWAQNVLAGEGGWGHVYPQVTWQPSMTEHASQVNADLTLSPTSMYRSAGTDGLDLGVRNRPSSAEPEQRHAPPIMVVTSPTAGATSMAPATIPSTADAADPDGEIAQGRAPGGPRKRRERTVCAAGAPTCMYSSVQAAVNAASDGDRIVLKSGEVFTESLVLPATPHAIPVVITSSTACPARRVTAADAGAMATLRPVHAAEAIIEGAGVAGWRFECLQFDSPGGLYNMVYIYNVKLGTGAFRNSSTITFDRVVMIGSDPNSVRNALYLNGANITVTKSHIANIHQQGAESKAIIVQDGPGPITITDNYLEAASINTLFGGGDQSSAAHIPNNITYTDNHLYKKPEWANKGYAVKNLFELKCATNVTVRNNLMENNYADGQNGTAVLFTARNDDGNSPWATVRHVVFEQNVVRNSPHGINFLGLNDGSATVRATDVTIQNNLFLTSGAFMLAGGEFGTIVIQHNTIVNGGQVMVLYESGLVWESGGGRRTSAYAIDNLTFRNNLAYHNEYGVMDADGQGFGTTALSADVNSYTWTHNALANRDGWQAHPGVNWYPSASEHQAQFNTDYTLVSGSWYRSAADDGRDLGRIFGVTGAPAAPKGLRVALNAR